jgi:NAD(P)-dependent dehydrogenase (short-subunit alcohol dehydrogenase family)
LKGEANFSALLPVLWVLSFSLNDRSPSGITETDMVAPDKIENAIKSVPMRRAGQPNEIAEAVAWLISDRASYTAGANIRVGGGRQ